MATMRRLKKMTVPEKLRAIEELWDDLQRTPSAIPSPLWHGDVLRARAARVREGAAHYGDWAEAKQRIRARTR